jgi:hypothetical protein
LTRWLIGVLPGLLVAAVAAQAPPSPSKIYACTTADGRRLTSDRPIPECLSKEQRLLRRDGSTQGVLPPAMSPEERAAAELKAREAAAAEVMRRDAARHDRNLLSRFPRQARHDAARKAALDDIVSATAASEKRLKDLAKERKTLDEEAEFYKNKALPPKLKQAVDANQASAEAQRLFILQQADEQARVNRRFDVELARLKKLWAGAAPGSLGPPPTGADEPQAPARKPASSSAAR